MTTTATHTTDVTTQTKVARATGANFGTAALQSAKRTVLQFFRTPQLLMLGTIQGALFLFMFRYIFGGAINPRMRSLPIPRPSVIVGRSLADTALTMWGIFVATVLAFIVGFRLNANIAEVALAVVVLLAAIYSFMWVFITIGLTSKSAQAATGTATLLIVPLAFVSAAYVPAQTLPGWMQPVSNNQPFTIFSNATRSLLLGGAASATAPPTG